MYRLICLAIGIGLINCDQEVYNTTAAATNIESTLGTPAILVDPTSITNQNTTDTVLEVGIFLLSAVANGRTRQLATNNTNVVHFAQIHG